MFYDSADDPRLLADLQQALKRWSRPTLGGSRLAQRLSSVEHQLILYPRSTRSSALRHTITEALQSLKRRGREEQVALLEQRYIAGRSIIVLTADYSLSERALYNRVREALVALAHQLWSAAMEEAPTSSSPVGPAASTPEWRERHLPISMHSGLIGVEEVLAQIWDWLSDTNDHWMLCLDGMGGLGKTTLARETARRFAHTDRFADIAWLTIQGGEDLASGPFPPTRPTLACMEVYSTVAYQLWQIDLSSEVMDVQRERLRTKLRERPYLVVVDNLAMVEECSEVLEMLWELTNPSKVLLTGRHRLQPGRFPWSVLTIAPLSRTDGIALVRSEARLRSLAAVDQASDETLQRIVAATGGNPLAIKLAVGQLVTLPLDRVLSNLENAKASSADLYYYLYDSVWKLLSLPARHLLLQFTRLPTCRGTWEDLTAVAGLSDDEFAVAVAELVDYSLVQTSGLQPKHYAIHPLTHHFAIRHTEDRWA